MSATIIAYTIIGSKVNREDFIIRDEHTVHGHCDELGPGKFCSSCGRPTDAVDVTRTPVEGFEEEGGRHCRGSIGGMDIIPVINSRGTEHFLTAVKKMVWIVNQEEPLIMPYPDIVARRDEMQATLVPLGLWVPENFGIWTALTHS